MIERFSLKHIGVLSAMKLAFVWSLILSTIYGIIITILLLIASIFHLTKGSITFSLFSIVIVFVSAFIYAILASIGTGIGIFILNLLLSITSLDMEFERR